MGSTFDSLGSTASIVTLIFFITGISQISDLNTKLPFLFTPIIESALLVIFILLGIFLIILIPLKEIRIEGQYRIKDHRINDLDLKISRLNNNGENLRLFLKQTESRNPSLRLQLLNLLKIQYLVVIRYPDGLKTTYERQNSDFKKLSAIPTELILSHPLNLAGRRSLDLTLVKDPESSFSGDGILEIDIFLSWPYRFLKPLGIYLIGSRNSINIKIIA